MEGSWASAIVGLPVVIFGPSIMQKHGVVFRGGAGWWRVRIYSGRARASLRPKNSAFARFLSIDALLRDPGGGLLVVNFDHGPTRIFEGQAIRR